MEKEKSLADDVIFCLQHCGKILLTPESLQKTENYDLRNDGRSYHRQIMAYEQRKALQGIEKVLLGLDENIAILDGVINYQNQAGTTLAELALRSGQLRLALHCFRHSAFNPFIHSRYSTQEYSEDLEMLLPPEQQYYSSEHWALLRALQKAGGSLGTLTCLFGWRSIERVWHPTAFKIIKPSSIDISTAAIRAALAPPGAPPSLGLSPAYPYFCGEAKQRPCPACNQKIGVGDFYLQRFADCQCPPLCFECALDYLPMLHNELFVRPAYQREIPKCPFCREMVSPGFIRAMLIVSWCRYPLSWWEFPAHHCARWMAETLLTASTEKRQKLQRAWEPWSQQSLASWEKAINSLLFATSPYYCLCPQTNCGGWALCSPYDEIVKICSGECQQKQTFRGPLNTGGYRQELAEQMIMVIAARTKGENIYQSCPGCQRWIEKNGGCQNMFCRFCGQVFTWQKDPEETED